MAWEGRTEAYEGTVERLKAEIAEMVADGNDPQEPTFEGLDPIPSGGHYWDEDDYYNAGRIAGLRFALDTLEGRL